MTSFLHAELEFSDVAAPCSNKEVLVSKIPPDSARCVTEKKNAYYSMSAKYLTCTLRSREKGGTERVLPPDLILLAASCSLSTST